MDTSTAIVPKRGNKLLISLFSVVILLLIVWWLIRNRYKFRSHGDIYNYPYEYVRAMGAISHTLPDGTIEYIYRNKNNEYYEFYTNNRVAYHSSNFKILKKGTYDFNEIIWDDKTRVSLKDVFS